MYPRLACNAFHYAPPWDSQPLEERLAALDGDLPRVAWLYERPDTSTFRYRVFNMVECLQSERPRRAAASWFSCSEIESLVSRLPDLDVLVLARVRYDAQVARLIAIARAHRVKVLFDCDDLVFDIGFVHFILDTLDQDVRAASMFDGWFAYCGRIEAVARLCDGGITTNDFLAARMADVVGGPVRVVPNYLNRYQQQTSDLLLMEKVARGFRGDGMVTVGYFSGSPSHNRDFAIAAPALARLLDADPQVNVRIVGFLDSTGPLGAFADRVEQLPLTDWVNLQRLIAEVEINIAPLQDNIFTNCKSELKFFEAAAVGTWTIATPTAAFEAVITSPEIGQLARADEWDAALADAVAGVRASQRHAAVAEANAEFVRGRYGWDRFGDRILEATLRDE
jgi:glycosyltransferase involved in cell wall biosynthesis